MITVFDNAFCEEARRAIVDMFENALSRNCRLRVNVSENDSEDEYMFVIHADSDLFTLEIRSNSLSSACRSAADALSAIDLVE